MGANTQAFCSSGIGKDVAGHRLKREAFHPSGHGISGGAGNFALETGSLLAPCRAVRGSRSTDPARAAALGPVVLWEIAQFRAVLGRVRDTLCMSVVLSINSVETGHSRNDSKRSRGFSFQEAEMGCASFLSA